MEMRRLGTSGLKVSEIGLGCNNFGGRTDQAGTQAVVDAAIEAGINLFDTADAYGGLRSEVFLGQALGKRRQAVVVATKFGLPISRDEPWRGGAARRWIMQAVEDSLKRLGTDYIDLYQLHKPDPDTPIEETLRAMDDLVRQGKVRYLGCSSLRGWQIADADWTAKAGGLNRFVSAQNNYSLLERGVEAEVLPACEKFGLGFLPFFPLASGLLTGKYQRNAPLPEGARLTAPDAYGREALNDRTFDKLDALTGWAQAHGRSLTELAFAWLLGHSAISSVIAGATSPEQVRINAANAGRRLTADEVREVGQLVAG